MGEIKKLHPNLHESNRCPPNTAIPDDAFAPDDPFGGDYLDYRLSQDSDVVPEWPRNWQASKG